jgi:hypothetical protein
VPSQVSGDTGRLGTRAAPRIDDRLVALIIHAAAGISAAELTRTVGSAADALGLPRPSYQQVRVLRRYAEEQAGRVTDMDVLVDIAFRARPATDLPNRWYGDPLPWRPGAKNEPRSK